MGVRFNHTMCDAFGLFQFMHTMAEMAQEAGKPSFTAVWKRELLNARHPPRITCTHHEYEESNTGQVSLDQTNLVQRSFFFDSSQIKAIRSHLPPHLRSCSKFELLTGCLWKCRTIALNLKPEEVVRVSGLVNARGKNRGPNLPLGYYGNAFASPAAVSKAGALCKNPLEYAVELVKKAKASMNEEYLRSVADLLVIRGRPPYVVTLTYLVTDVTSVPLGRVNFGWGNPIYAGPAMAFPRISFYVKHKNDVEDGILVPICLPFSAMERFQEEVMKMTKEVNTYNISDARITSAL